MPNGWYELFAHIFFPLKFTVPSPGPSSQEYDAIVIGVARGTRVLKCQRGYHLHHRLVKVGPLGVENTAKKQPFSCGFL